MTERQASAVWCALIPPGSRGTSLLGFRSSGGESNGGEGGNRTHHPARSVGATVLKTVTTTRHVSLSVHHPTARPPIYPAPQPRLHRSLPRAESPPVGSTRARR